MKWIKCEDYLPEIGQYIIGFNGYVVSQCLYNEKKYAKTKKGRNPRFENAFGIWHGVTYWMPLPEPPAT